MRKSIIKQSVIDDYKKKSEINFSLSNEEQNKCSDLFQKLFKKREDTRINTLIVYLHKECGLTFFKIQNLLKCVYHLYRTIDAIRQRYNRTNNL